MELLRWK